MSTEAAAEAYDGPVNDEGWPLTPEGYVLELEVGQGAFARVLKAHCPSKAVHVAVKIMAFESLTSSLEEIQAEVRTMKLSRHEDVLALHCCFVVKSDLWLVMPLMSKGSCYHVLRCLRKVGRLRDGQGLSEEAIATILRETLLGLDYIHSHGQIHRDIKAGNILLSPEGRVAIADFGVAGWMSETGDRSTKGPCKTFVGTPCWMAPEVMEQTRGYNEKADIWSVGITALELFKGYAPYAKLPPMQVLIKTIREPPPTLRAYGDEKTPGLPVASDRFQKFIARCLQKDPRDRPSAHELLSDPFIKRGAKPSRQLAELLLHDVPEVGSAEAAKLEGGEVKPMAPYGTGARGATLVPGTTWVFPDDAKAGAGGAAGATGLAGDADSGAGEGAMSNEALDELLEQGLQTLGEAEA